MKNINKINNPFLQLSNNFEAMRYEANKQRNIRHQNMREVIWVRTDLNFIPEFFLDRITVKCSENNGSKVLKINWFGDMNDSRTFTFKEFAEFVKFHPEYLNHLEVKNGKRVIHSGVDSYEFHRNGQIFKNDKKLDFGLNKAEIENFENIDGDRLMDKVLNFLNKT